MKSLSILPVLFLLIAAFSPVESSTIMGWWKSITASFTPTVSVIEPMPVASLDADPAASDAPFDGEFVCPTMAEDCFCSTEYLPVICDEVCEYSNDCVASTSGYDVEVQCRLVDNL